MLNNKIASILYEGNGATTSFSFPFRVWDSSQVLITVSDENGIETVVSSDCKITVTDTGGTVEYKQEDGTPLPEGCKLAIERSMPFVQEDEYVNGTRFDPAEIEDALDIACAERQQLLERLDRAILAPVTSGVKGSDAYLDKLFSMSDEAEANAQAAAKSASLAEGYKDQSCACATRAQEITDQLLDLSFSMHVSPTESGATEYTPSTGMVHFYVPRGPQGIQGEQGIQGIQGPQGVKGDKGDQGIQGVQGEKGDKGDQGIQGVKGDIGLTGPAGPAGPAGPVGDITTALDATLIQFSVVGSNLVMNYTNAPDLQFSLNDNGELVMAVTGSVTGEDTSSGAGTETEDTGTSETESSSGSETSDSEPDGDDTTESGGE